MIEKVFKNEQSKDFLAYLTTLGYRLDKFIAGKGMYGNRVSVMRSRKSSEIYAPDCDFKGSEFMVVEGIRAMEMKSTILANRQRAESHLTGEESMADCLSAFSDAFLSQDDMQKCAKNWYDCVSKKLLSSTETSFNRLNNFILGSMLKYLPITIAERVAEFRQENMLTYLTQDILDADFVKKQLELFPASREKLASLKQRIMRKEIERAQMREAEKSGQNAEQQPVQIQDGSQVLVRLRPVSPEQQPVVIQKMVQFKNGDGTHVQSTMNLDYGAEKVPA